MLLITHRIFVKLNINQAGFQNTINCGHENTLVSQDKDFKKQWSRMWKNEKVGCIEDQSTVLWNLCFTKVRDLKIKITIGHGLKKVWKLWIGFQNGLDRWTRHLLFLSNTFSNHTSGNRTTSISFCLDRFYPVHPALSLQNSIPGRVLSWRGSKWHK